jgi:hypothetical protein
MSILKQSGLGKTIWTDVNTETVRAWENIWTDVNTETVRAWVNHLD